MPPAPEARLISRRNGVVTSLGLGYVSSCLRIKHDQSLTAPPPPIVVVVVGTAMSRDVTPVVIDSKFSVSVGLVVVGQDADRARKGAKRREFAGNNG